MSEKLYNVKQCLRNNGVVLTIIIYYRKVLNKVYNYLVLGRLDTNIDSRANLLGLKYIKLGENFSAGRGLWLEAVTRYNGKNTNPKIIIGNDVSFSEYNHIGAVSYIEIGNNVLLGSRCYITDHNHGIYKGDSQSCVSTPPIKRDLTTDGSIVIEDNVWIGDNVVILPNVKIGYGSIVGANSVVTEDIPPSSIAVGIPVKVIKVWNNTTTKWEWCDSKRNRDK
ncbi:DapH/DapD/GlmU-related protein [Megasphaera sp.]|uniref:DapH/DapD/GlmU-related protein n=1 Tax=Megasphaera TaxID=906 RepID=UPI001D2594D3|nr:DapH/DapD/GlmU-related protein [Megasphaera sp.]MBS6790252.1 hypothetical protein [Megasphaera sp.]